jgi:hypothetical protein
MVAKRWERERELRKHSASDLFPFSQPFHFLFVILMFLEGILSFPRDEVRRLGLAENVENLTFFRFVGIS